VLVLGHRQEIIDQIESALTLMGVEYGKIAAGCPGTDLPVQIASVATLARPRRLERGADKFDFVVIDEAHHSVSRTWARVIASQPEAKILGVSATPQRLDGKGLREQFDRMVAGPSTAGLIEAGWLSPFTVYEPTGAPDLSGARIRAGDFATEDLRIAMGGVVVGSAVDQYQRICPGVPAVAFCADRDHSRAVAERFCAPP
jgi:DNA repair protein RadD